MAATVAIELPIYRLDVATYHRLADAGALEGMDVELLEGMLFDKHSDREDPIHRIDVGTYNRIVASGALDDKPVELLEGLLVEMSPKSSDHIFVLNELMLHFAVKRPRWVQIQDPIEVAWDCEPEPDLAVAAQKPSHGLKLRTALFIVEVAVSSHRVDREVKAHLYARAQVPTYWLVDVPARAIEIRTQPGANGYEKCDVYREGSIAPSPLDGIADLDIAALFADIER